MPSTQAQSVFQLRRRHYLPHGPFLQLEKDVVQRIDKRTHGQVRIDITLAEGLGKGTELLMRAARGAHA